MFLAEKQAGAVWGLIDCCVVGLWGYLFSKNALQKSKYKIKKKMEKAGRQAERDPALFGGGSGDRQCEREVRLVSFARTGGVVDCCLHVFSFCPWL